MDKVSLGKMTTLRTYLRETEALLAKSRLEAFEIPCALADENAHLYGGAPFAMPIRILVPDEFVAEAVRILDAADDDAVAASEAVAPAVDSEMSPMSVARSNPWQILVVALVFFGPGLALLLLKRPMILIFGGARRNRPVPDARRSSLVRRHADRGGADRGDILLSIVSGHSTGSGRRSSSSLMRW